MMKIIASVVLILISLFTGLTQSRADDVDLFLAQISPDALIVFDLSGSMKLVPTGETMYIGSTQFCGTTTIPYYPTSGTGHTKACTISTDNPVKYGDASCSGPFYVYSQTGYSTDCSRLAIANRSIFNLLDDNNDNAVNSQDETSLGVRLGYMRFRDGDDTAVNYNDGNIRLGRKNTSGCTESTSASDALEIGASYSNIYNRINCETANSGTPLASSLNEAKIYLDAHKAGDTSKACRKKFVILITDGSDTYSCSGNGQETQVDQYKRRRESVAKAKVLSDAGYKVFVVGFGAGMPHYLKNTLNWMAYYGGTDNALVANTGDTAQYSIPTGSFYPSGIGSCDASSYSSHTVTPDASHYFASTTAGSGVQFYDPGESSLNGYAFFAEDASQLTASLKAIKTYIQEKSSSSITGSAIPSARLVDNDIGYVSSLEIPSWRGDLKAYQLNADGTLPVDETTKKITASPIWDAGVKLNEQNPSDRKIYTYLGGTGKEEFKSSNTNLTKEALGVADDTNRGKVIDHIRGIDAYDLNQNGNTTESREWKLGDIFHSNAVIVGQPSRFFEDQGFSGTGGFYQTNKDRTKVVIAGANDGMLHAFNASTGVEEWGFIPKSLLKSLQSMISSHMYYVDSSPKVSDVWFYNTSTDATKSADEWKTVLVCGLRKGGKTDVVLGTNGLNYTCIKDHIGATENRPITGASWTTYWAQQGTGGTTWAAGTGYSAKTWQYFALDITNTLIPQYLWEFPKSTDAVTLAKVGQSWSEPVIGRVKIEVGGELYERWVAFIGGGFDGTNSTGKAFFVVDIKTGDILKEFSGLTGMNYSFAAPPTAVDTNSDGFIDKIYIGDLGGQMWVFDVSFDLTTKKSESQWTGRILFTAPSSAYRIYYQPAVAFDRYGTSWVYFGTGDREHPNDLSGPTERFYAIRDNGVGNYPRTEADLSDVTSSNTFNPTSQAGWYIQLAKSADQSEKVLARSVVFNKLVYFTTYTYTTTANPCSVPGEAKLYIVEYLSAGGTLGVDDSTDLEGSPSQQRSITIGPGAPSNPAITVDSKGQASVTVGTTGDQILSTKIFSPLKSKEILYWREVTP
jgi:Tfp pilus tip-associated adhesin PilY1